VDRIDVVLTEGAEAGAAARRAVLEGDGTVPTSVRDDVLLLLSELVTNAVRHAGAGPERPLRVQLQRASQRVLVAVADGGPGFAGNPKPPPGTESGGWGLFIVDQVADRWGVERTPSGSRVWFEIRYEG
jgi:anti-sigma regulatory factor (Ser/Thr protein kinase)